MRVDELTVDECWQQFAEAELGRLACSHDGQPYVIPIHFVFDADYACSVSGLGQKVEWMRGNPLVCVEIDEVRRRDEWVSIVALGGIKSSTMSSGAVRRLSAPNSSCAAAGCRDLIRVADVQIDKARNDLSIARLGLAELELKLTTRSLWSTTDRRAAPMNVEDAMLTSHFRTTMSELMNGAEQLKGLAQKAGGRWHQGDGGSRTSDGSYGGWTIGTPEHRRGSARGHHPARQRASGKQGKVGLVRVGGLGSLASPPRICYWQCHASSLPPATAVPRPFAGTTMGSIGS